MTGRPRHLPGITVHRSQFECAFKRCRMSLARHSAELKRKPVHSQVDAYGAAIGRRTHGSRRFSELCHREPCMTPHAFGFVHSCGSCVSRSLLAPARPPEGLFFFYPPSAVMVSFPEYQLQLADAGSFSTSAVSSRLRVFFCVSHLHCLAPALLYSNGANAPPRGCVVPISFPPMHDPPSAPRLRGHKSLAPDKCLNDLLDEGSRKVNYAFYI